jgi:hypothetical protein
MAFGYGVISVGYGRKCLFLKKDWWYLGGIAGCGQAARCEPIGNRGVTWMR